MNTYAQNVHARLFDAAERGRIGHQEAAVLYASVIEGTVHELGDVSEYAEYLIESGEEEVAR